MNLFSSKNTFQRVNLIVEMLMYAICIISIIYFGIIGAYPKCSQAGLIIVVLILFRALLHWTKSDISPVLRLSILIFIAIAMMLANLFGMYGMIPYLDKIEHLLSGVILYYVGLFIIQKLIHRYTIDKLQASSIAIWFAFLFAGTMAAMWEVYEFTVDHLFKLHSQNGSLTDTMIDIICGLLGAAFVTIISLLQARPAKRSK